MLCNLYSTSPLLFMNSTTLRNALFTALFLLVAGALYFAIRPSAPETPHAAFTMQHTPNGVFLPEGSPLRERIRTSSVEMQSVQRTIQAPASVEANPAKRANFFPPAGGRIVRLLVNMGDAVRADQALFEIYSPEMAEIQAEFNSARSAMLQAERALSKAQDLHDKGIIPRRELEEIQTEFDIVRSEMQSMELKLPIFGMSEEDLGRPLMVRSPINGRIIDLQVSAGEFIAEAEEPLMIVADLSCVCVYGSLRKLVQRPRHRTP